MQKYRGSRRKCPPGCTCKRHTPLKKKCPPGCRCGKHTSLKRGGKGRIKEKCPPDCTCKKHTSPHRGGKGKGGHTTVGQRRERNLARIKKAWLEAKVGRDGLKRLSLTYFLEAPRDIVRDIVFTEPLVLTWWGEDVYVVMPLGLYFARMPRNPNPKHQPRQVKIAGVMYGEYL